VCRWVSRLESYSVQQADREVRWMSTSGVRRDKAALSSGCKFHPATAPAGSNPDPHPIENSGYSSMSI
jgi:hypothetical protein